MQNYSNKTVTILSLQNAGSRRLRFHSKGKYYNKQSLGLKPVGRCWKLLAKTATSELIGDIG
jgi:hypothetical protein